MRTRYWTLVVYTNLVCPIKANWMKEQSTTWICRYGFPPLNVLLKGYLWDSFFRNLIQTRSFMYVFVEMSMPFANLFWECVDEEMFFMNVQNNRSSMTLFIVFIFNCKYDESTTDFLKNASRQYRQFGVIYFGKWFQNGFPQGVLTKFIKETDLPLHSLLNTYWLNTERHACVYGCLC